MIKLHSQRRHAKRRASERYDLHLNRMDLKQLVTKIQNSDGKFVESLSLRTAVWLLEHEGKPVKVVYDRNRKTIVTFLPL